MQSLCFHAQQLGRPNLYLAVTCLDDDQSISKTHVSKELAPFPCWDWLVMLIS